MSPLPFKYHVRYTHILGNSENYTCTHYFWFDNWQDFERKEEGAIGANKKKKHKKGRNKKTSKFWKKIYTNTENKDMQEQLGEMKQTSTHLCTLEVHTFKALKRKKNESQLWPEQKASFWLL